MVKRSFVLLCVLALAACGKTQPVQAPAASSASTTPQYAYVVVPSPEPAAPATAPKILEVALFSREYRAPSTVGVRVRTSSDVTAVTARLLGRERAVPKISDGTFEAIEQLPDLPFFLKGRDYTVDFVAATNDGRTASAQVTVHLDR